VEWLALLVPGKEQGRSPPRPRSSLGSGGTGCALRLPAVAVGRKSGIATTLGFGYAQAQITPMFSLSYRDDPGLEFLRFCSQEDLKDFSDILMFDKGELRYAEQLSGDSRFTDSRHDLAKAWKIIAAELQRFGADTVAAFFRGGEGVLYKEILEDVCGYLKVDFREAEDLSDVEDRVLISVLKSSLEKMTEKERAEFAKSAGPVFGDGKFDTAGATPAAILAALQAAIAMGGFAAFQVAAIAANAVAKFVLGRGLTLAANAGLMRFLGVIGGPIGVAISAILTVPMITGTAFRVTVPGVIFVAYLRHKQSGGTQL